MLNMKKNFKKLLFIYKKCKSADSSFLLVYSNYLYRKLKTKKNIIAHENLQIKGIENIEIGKIDNLEIGLKIA